MDQLMFLFIVWVLLLNAHRCYLRYICHPRNRGLLRYLKCVLYQKIKSNLMNHRDPIFQYKKILKCLSLNHHHSLLDLLVSQSKSSLCFSLLNFRFFFRTEMVKQSVNVDGQLLLSLPSFWLYVLLPFLFPLDWILEQFLRLRRPQVFIRFSLNIWIILLSLSATTTSSTTTTTSTSKRLFFLKNFNEILDLYSINNHNTAGDAMDSVKLLH